MPSQADLPSGFTGLRYTTTPAARAALTAHPQQNVPAAEVAGFRIHLELVTAAAAAAAAATNVNLRVTLVRIQVFKDQYFSGNWEIRGVVNGRPAGNTMGSDANLMDVIQLDWPPASVSLSENDTLRFRVSSNTASGNNDEASVTYSRNTNPPWGIGTWGAISNSGSFILRYELEWDQSDF
jgi:hypothetical protein